jgi:diacylglycerol kinase family enzyme
VHRVTAMRHTRMGRLWYRLWADSLYVVAGLWAALGFSVPRFRVRADDQWLAGDFAGSHFCNFRTFGKSMHMAPDANPGNGRLDYQVRHRGALPWLVWHLIAAALHRRSPAFISSYGSARSLRVESDDPVPVQLDGDFWGEATALEVEILPAEATLLVPGDRLTSE